MIINTWNTEYDIVTEAANSLGLVDRYIDPCLNMYPNNVHN
jgi:hypothetical protein